MAITKKKTINSINEHVFGFDSIAQTLRIEWKNFWSGTNKHDDSLNITTEKLKNISTYKTTSSQMQAGPDESWERSHQSGNTIL